MRLAQLLCDPEHLAASGLALVVTPELDQHLTAVTKNRRRSPRTLDDECERLIEDLQRDARMPESELNAQRPVRHKPSRLLAMASLNEQSGRLLEMQRCAVQVVLGRVPGALWIPELGAAEDRQRAGTRPRLVGGRRLEYTPCHGASLPCVGTVCDQVHRALGFGGSLELRKA